MDCTSDGVSLMAAAPAFSARRLRSRVQERHSCYNPPHCNGWAFGKRSLEKGRVHEELAMPVRALNTTIPFGSRYPVPHRFASDRFPLALSFRG